MYTNGLACTRCVSVSNGKQTLPKLHTIYKETFFLSSIFIYSTSSRAPVFASFGVFSKTVSAYLSLMEIELLCTFYGIMRMSGGAACHRMPGQILCRRHQETIEDSQTTFFFENLVEAGDKRRVMATVPTFKSHESSQITIPVSTYVYNSAVRALFFNNSLQRIMFARHLKYLRVTFIL